MRIFTRFAAAAVLATGVSFSAAANEWLGPRLVGSGDNVTVEYATPSANVVGGALSRVTGSGADAGVEVISGGRSVQGRVARLVGSGESLQIIYQDAAPSAQRLAQAGQRG